ncbi:MAG: AraC family transcriptional regulator, partial [Firmicutes bacterium]|nr:AraC family transcriptional regulator [Bacillota bacterium]
RISVGPDQKILPMLLAIDYLKEETNDGRDEVMLFAVRNIAAEIFLEGFEGCVFQNHDGNNMALVYPAKDFEGIAAERCARLINSCGEYLGFGLSCFIGEPAVPAGLRKEYLALLDMRENNLTDYNAVLFRKNARPRSADETPACLPDISEWLALFETGNKEALIGKALEFIHRIESGKAASDAGDMVRSGIMYMLHYGMMQNGLRLSDVPGFKNLSLERFGGRLGRWAKSSIDSCMDYIAKNGGNLSQNIKKAKDFIEAHYREDITRDDIARHVYLNPMYLSRLFKKETGTLLSDYILNRRIEAARRLLTETNKNISTIAESVGYANLSYFAKAFRNVLGVTPQEYRKNMKQ